MTASVKDAVDTSRMDARKMFASWMTSLRTLRLSARTLHSTSSRRMECSAERRRTEWTGTSLESWLVISWVWFSL